jgi:hypothetical protein
MAIPDDPRSSRRGKGAGVAAEHAARGVPATQDRAVDHERQ